MSERDGYQPGVPCWVDTLQPDPDAATGYYGAVFGWDFDGPGPMPGDGRYFVARLRGRDVAGVGSLPPGAPPSWSTYVQVESADAAAERALEAGGHVVAEPFDAPPAGRIAVLADPGSASICVWEPGERKGAQLVNEPGAWAMSALRAHDTEGAKAFYGAVFGWTTESFGPDVTMFRVPGYVGGEPQQPVSREVVATMLPAQDGRQQWIPDFWVHDVDEAAARSGERGGSVLAGPFDTPIGRTAMLADPQGVPFTVTRIAVP
jgi:uncharacterized protein